MKKLAQTKTTSQRTIPKSSLTEFISNSTTKTLTNVEVERRLNSYRPRPYQKPILKALDDGFKRVLAILPRRAGKDVTALNYVIRQMWEHPGVYYYIFPTYSQAKKVIWDSITNEGKKVLDYFPAEIVLQKNSQEMKIRMRAKNGEDSLFQLIGSDNYDSLMGTNPRGCVFSEYALQDPLAYQYIRPILTANQGWALFISTPRGKNHLWTLSQLAQVSPDWFYYKLTIEETEHIPMEEIAKEKSEGILSDDMIQQEYYTSFEMGVEGSYYSRYIDKMKRQGMIGMVPWENGFKVHTAWDIGVRDQTSIIFFQTIGQTVRIIDCYENSKHGLEHYAEVLSNKPYLYGTHIAPHDIRVKEWGSGITRFEKARQLGIKFTIADKLEIPDGIEACRSLFSKLWIDEEKAQPLIKALENYRQEYDNKKKIYKPRPLHDWSSHFCFEGNTKVITRTGFKKIRKVKNGDEVLTLEGWEKCSGARITRKKAPLLEVEFTDGTKVRCTRDHAFLTSGKWTSAVFLEPGKEITSSLISQTTPIIPEPHEEPTLILHGKSFSKKLKKVFTFIKYYGIREKFSFEEVIKNKIDRPPYFFYLKNRFKNWLKGWGLGKKFVVSIGQPLFVKSVKDIKKRKDVWCISVEFSKHFSLANGAIVHNCDSLRYLAISLPKTRDGISPVELENRYQEAMGGSQSKLPAFFQDGAKYVNN